MRNFIAMFLLFVFITNITNVFANEVNTISSDNQADNKQSSKEKIFIKKIDINDPTLIKYNNKFQRYSDYPGLSYHRNEIFISSVLQGYKYYKYPEIDNISKNNKNILKINLQDGDYAILDLSIKGNKKYKYVAEYHADGHLFGIVQIKTIYKTHKSTTLAFFEYRISEQDVYYQKHVMYLDITKNKNGIDIAQFIYRIKNPIYRGDVCLSDLICYQINNDLFLNEESKNLIVKMKKFDIPQETITLNPEIKSNLSSIGTGISQTLELLSFPLILVGAVAFGIITAPLLIINPNALDWHI